jgi:NAD(P)-dependent dehydrogenase (short-subunit alcohol dehydrogenase family)
MFNRHEENKTMANHKAWTEAQVPNMTGKVAIVTGANSGIGYETARVLAQRGATAIMACRSLSKANEAAAALRATRPAGPVEVMELDLGDLDAVRRFAGEFRARYTRLDLLINNAGIMVPPYGKTAQGFETQFGVNHLGHFALTGLLLDQLTQTPGARVVTVSSGAHLFGTINFDDLNAERKYDRNRAYAQSKLANLLFTYELQRRLQAAGLTTLAVAAHPGWTATNLQVHSGISTALNPYFAQEQSMGALPTLYAATAAGVQGSEYYGPDGFMQFRGHPKKVSSNKRSQDRAVATRLWEVSEEMTGVTYHFARVEEPRLAV